MTLDVVKDREKPSCIRHNAVAKVNGKGVLSRSCPLCCSLTHSQVNNEGS